MSTSSTKIFVLKCWFGSGTYKLDQKQLVRISTQRYDVMLFTNADSIIIVNLSSCESHCSRPVEVSSEKKYLNIFGSFLFFLFLQLCGNNFSVIEEHRSWVLALILDNTIIRSVEMRILK